MLEQSLETFQAEVEGSLNRATTLGKRLKKLKSAAQTGDLREIEKSLPDIKELASSIQQEAERLEFDFDEAGYFPAAFLDELAKAAREEGLTVFVQDGKLYCYPLLVRVKAGDRAVQIGKKLERGIRPSALASKLKRLQSSPQRFKPADFLSLLHRAWRHCASSKESPVLTLAEIYDVITLMPGSAKEYTRDDFAKDLYLLDSSGIDRMDNGTRFQFSASTGTRNAASTFISIAEDGAEKRYYGIAFAKVGEALE